MTPLRARYGKIERLVRDLLLENGVGEAPVPVEEIVRKAGIEVRRGDLGDVSGLLIRTQDQNVIGVNSTQSRPRQRFTIAHEYAHFVLHEGMTSHVDKDYRVNFRSDESALAVNIEEIEANHFAASLLMPRHFLDADGALAAIDSDARVAALAGRYKVSRHAMSLRLGNVYRRYLPY